MMSDAGKEVQTRLDGGMREEGVGEAPSFDIGACQIVDGAREVAADPIVRGAIAQIGLPNRDREFVRGQVTGAALIESQPAREIGRVSERALRFMRGVEEKRVTARAEIDGEVVATLVLLIPLSLAPFIDA